ncbi:MAG: hypothetical protein OIN66_18700 [Candidatus Methanoperedens sp.]|nr:hypothetical protein [Candidatus Methanoperedens sp.]
MKLKALETYFATRLTSKLRNNISKDFRYKILAETAKEDINSLIVLGNGNIDDLAVPIVCHHLNGNKIVGITKPDGKKRLNALSELPTYISRHKIDKIALIMDQEEDDLDEIFNQAEKKLMDQHIQFDVVNNNNRFKQYQCKHGSRTFDFILIISGLNDFHTKTHKIEDHLVKGAFKLSRISEDPQDSKETWNSVDTHTQGEILNGLVKSKSISSEVFPQHFNGLRLLEEQFDSV